VARLNRPWVAPVLLALITGAMTLWLARWALLNHSWGNDEELYRHFAQGVSNDFGLLFHMDPSYGRGIQRLHLFVLALPLVFFKNPLAFEIAHILFVAIYTSAAIPAWLIARGSGLSPLAALVPAVLVVLTPWAVITTSFLAEPIAYGLFAWTLWSIWRAALRPSIGADLLAVVLMLLAVLSHTGFLLLLPVLPVVAVLQAGRYATGSGDRGARARALPAAALRRQPLAIALGVAGVLVLLFAWVNVLPGGLARFTGTYSTNLPPLWLMADKWRSFLSRVDAGTGFVLFAAAIPWLIARVIRPLEPALHALAWTLLLGSCVVLFGLVGGPGDERYVMYMGFTIPLAATVALIRRQLSPMLALLGAAAAFILFFKPGWRLVDPSDFGYFGYPAEHFMGRVGLVKLGNAVSSVAPFTTAKLLLAAALAAVVVIAAVPRLRRWLPLVILPAALFQLAASGFAINKHVNTVGAHHGPGLHTRSWVDERVPKGENVGLLAVSEGLTGDYNPIWREIQYWNTTTRSVVKINSPVTTFPSVSVPYPFGTKALEPPLDVQSGRVLQARAFPRYLVIPQPPLSVILDWRDVARATYIPAKLVEVQRPLQARAVLDGVTPNGSLQPPRPAQMRVYSSARPQPRCVILDLLAPPVDASEARKSLPYSISPAGKGPPIVKGRIAAGKTQRVYVPVRFGNAESVAWDITTSGTLVTPNIGPQTLYIGNWEPSSQPCPS
jgi:hypothetical protein